MSERSAFVIQFGAYGLAVLLSIIALVNLSFDLSSYAQGVLPGDELEASVRYWLYYFIGPSVLLWLIGRAIAFFRSPR